MGLERVAMKLKMKGIEIEGEEKRMSDRERKKNNNKMKEEKKHTEK